MKYRNKTAKGKTTKTNKPYTDRSAARPVITVNYEKYAHFLEDIDWSEEQKAEWLQALWNIIVEFVSLGWGVHPLQQAQDSCGKLKENGLIPPLTAADRVLLNKEILTENFEYVSGLETGAGAEGVKE